MENIKDLIAKIENTHDYENLEMRTRSGEDLKELVRLSKLADQELNILHNCITELYNKDCNVIEIKKALLKIKKINGNKR